MASSLSFSYFTVLSKSFRPGSSAAPRRSSGRSVLDLPYHVLERPRQRLAGGVFLVERLHDGQQVAIERDVGARRGRIVRIKAVPPVFGQVFFNAVISSPATLSASGSRRSKPADGIPADAKGRLPVCVGAEIQYQRVGPIASLTSAPEARQDPVPANARCRSRLPSAGDPGPGAQGAGHGATCARQRARGGPTPDALVKA